MPGVAAAKVAVLEHDHCVAVWGPVVILIWRHETTLDGVRAVDERLHDFARTNPSGGGLMTIIEANAPLPEAHVRDALAGVLKKHPVAIKSSAVVHEGSGFRAAAVRGVVTGLTLLARQPFPHRIFATVDDGSRWLAASLRETAPHANVDGEHLIEAVRELRQRIASA